MSTDTEENKVHFQKKHSAVVFNNISCNLHVRQGLWLGVRRRYKFVLLYHSVQEY